MTYGQTDRQTDRRTDGQTLRSWLKRAKHSCRAEKVHCVSSVQFSYVALYAP